MDGVKFHGLLRIRDIPQEWTEDEFKYWWCDEYTESGAWVHKARMSDKEKERRTIFEAQNLVLQAGITQILTFLGTVASTTPAFGQYYAVGTGAIYLITPSDPSLASELFRKQPTGNTIGANAVMITTQFLTTEGNGTYTNAGLFGKNATGTANSGTLMTHLLVSFTKDISLARANDYTISAQPS